MRYSLSENPIAAPIGSLNGQPINLPTLELLRRWLSQNHPDDGSRLPAERQLALVLGVTRPELRKALALLEAEGRVTRQVGRGTFTAKPAHPSQIIANLSALTERTGPHDAMIARLAVEPELAQMAALYATPLQVSRAQTLAAEIRAAKTWDEYEDRDHALHDLIAESSGNVLLHELHKIMNAVRQVVVWRQLSPGIDRPPPDYHSFDEHDAIVGAIATRDRAAARKAMRNHLQSTLNAMTAED